MGALRLYHNPRCSKSREALELLKARRAALEVVEYLDAPLAKAELERLVRLVGGDPNLLLRRKDPKFKAAGLDSGKTYTAREVVAILAEHGHLMERPIAVLGQRAAIGRPVERVLELLE
ncbi:MAG: arsenate reductase (glutaredoxin) [Planctomycetota bacterium]|nr:arsenate reductase (glutaredoxin) [Planctomycetota bacterium]